MTAHRPRCRPVLLGDDRAGLDAPVALAARNEKHRLHRDVAAVEHPLERDYGAVVAAGQDFGG